MRYILILIISFVLASCAVPLPSSSMLPMSNVYETIPSNRALHQSIAIGNVYITEGAGGAYAPITEHMFKEALKTSLLMANYHVRNKSEPKYILDAHVLEIQQPFAGFSMEVITKISYTLRTSNKNSVVYADTLTLAYTASFSEAPDGTQRLRIATGKAIRENITHLLRVLSDQELK